MQIQTDYGTIELPDGSSQEDIEDAVDDFVSRSRSQKPKAPELPYTAADRIADNLPWSDEIRGAINGTARFALDKLRGRDAEWGKGVDAATDEARQRREKFSEDHPFQNAAAIGAGLVVGGAPKLAGEVAVTGGNALARFFAPSIEGIAPRLAAKEAATAAPSTLGTRVLDGVKIGGTVGALEGSGDADNGDLGDRLKGAVGGGALGAGFGAAIPLAGSAFSGIWSHLKPIFGGSNANSARDRILAALADDGVTLPDAEARMARWATEGAKPETLAEALGGGPNIAATLKAAGSVPGPAKAAIRDTFDGRMRGQADRITGDVVETAGARNDFYGVDDGLSQAQRVTATTLYDAAFAQPMPPSARLNDFLQNRHVRDGLRKGIDDELNLATAEGRAPRAFNDFVEFGSDGGINSIRTPTWAVLDTAKRGLDAIVGRAIEENHGRVPRDMVSINELRKSYTRFLREHNDDYRGALDAWSGPAASREALDTGRSFLTRDAEEIAREVGRLRPGDREHYLEGVTRAIRDQVEKVSPTANSARVFDLQPYERKLRAAFGDEAYERFAARMRRENDMATFSRDANPAIGSQTIPNGEAIDAARSASGAFGAGLANGRGLLGSTGFALRQMLNRRIYRDPRTNAELADTLLEQDPLRQAVLIANLRGRIRDFAAGGVRRDAATHGLQLGTANGTGAFAGSITSRRDR